MNIGGHRSEPRTVTVGTADEDRLLVLARQFQYSPRRAIGLCGPGVLESVLAHEIQGALEAPVRLVCDCSGAVAFAAVTADQWLAENLGIRIGRVSTVFSAGGDSRGVAVGEVLAEVVRRSPQHGHQLLILRLDATDTAAIAAATAEGFVVVDTEPVYTARAGAPVGGQPEVSGAAAGLSVTLYSPDEPWSVDPKERERLLGRAAQFGISHFGLDPAIPASATARMYRSWTANSIDGLLGDVVAIGRVDGRIVGFYAGSRDEQLWRDHSIDLINRIWSVVSLEGAGVFTALASAVFNREGPNDRWIECETQGSNVAVNRAMTTITGTTPTSTCVSLHRWL